VAKKTVNLREAVELLREHYGRVAPPPTKEPFELILWENVAYLPTPARRRTAFELLRKDVGTSPEAILSARREDLERVTSVGILGEQFATKLRECAEIAVQEFDGDLDAVVRGPVDGAKRALRRFPGIGEPGAEKILLFSGQHAFLAPDSNALRVLARLDLVREETSYGKTYAAARDVTKGWPAKPGAFQEAHLLLQHHGQTLCKRSAPLCGACPLVRTCAYAAAHHYAPARTRSTAVKKGTKKATRKGRGS
jgi:endonuclease III